MTPSSRFNSEFLDLNKGFSGINNLPVPAQKVPPIPLNQLSENSIFLYSLLKSKLLNLKLKKTQIRAQKSKCQVNALRFAK